MPPTSTWEDQAWQEYFRRHAIELFVVTYEDLWQAPGEVARRILSHLGIPPPARLQVRGWCHQRQADALSDEWVERYDARRRAVAAGSLRGLAGEINA